MSAQAEIPVSVGRYEIVERLAAGGMGEVFLARVAGPGGFIKPVALKRIHPHLVSDTEFISMLHDEARLAASVQHPNIVRTLDVGCEGDTHYVVLDFVCGDQIGKIHRELLRRGLHVPPWVAAWAGAQIAGALHAVHEARSLDGQPLEIVHRDVSPGNIMLADSGHALLFDFGVAKAKHRIAHTTHGEIKGKLCFMAPEIFDGVPADRTGDVFALGVVLYELLTDRSPFNRPSDLDTIAALRSAEVPPPSTFAAGIDAELDVVVMRAMARDRAARYGTASQLEAALRQWATRAGAPHDAGATCTWLVQMLPDRIAARRELLTRVGSGAPMRPTPSASPSASGGAYSDSQPSRPSTRRPITGTTRTDGLTEVMTTPVPPFDPSAGLTPVPPYDGLHTPAGLSRLTTEARLHVTPSAPMEMPAPRRGVGLAVAGAVVAIVAVAAVAIGTMMSGSPATAPVAATPPPATTAAAADEPEEEPEDSAPTSTSSSTASSRVATPPRGGRPRQPPPPKAPPPKTGGPLQREYD
jgi:eukaryotic-like serine/threonine-protein kinase